MIRKYYQLLIPIFLLAHGCQEEPSTSNKGASESALQVATDRIDIPPVVRSNLGISFAKVDARYVSRTIRAPGRFELDPRARREYRTMLGGRVELHVNQYGEVEPGTLLFSIDSPQWRELQAELSETESKLLQAKARSESFGPLFAAHERHHDVLDDAVAIWSKRVKQLEKSRESGVVSEGEIARARAELASKRALHAEAMEKEAELKARRSEVSADRIAAENKIELLLLKASSLLGISPSDLTATKANSAEGYPRWREIRFVEVRAEAPGVVESIALTNGAWSGESNLVLTTVQPKMLRFRAMGLQSDLTRFSAGASARIVPPRAPGVEIGDAVTADLTIGLEAHPDERIISLIAVPNEHRPWMRLGVSAFLEIVVESSGGKALAIPRSAIVKDGITHVFFRRDPGDPNKAIRVEADMGVDDGRWVVINSGLTVGDEVVLEGAYELKLATTQNLTSQKGGHFHADGTFHNEH